MVTDIGLNYMGSSTPQTLARRTRQGRTSIRYTGRIAWYSCPVSLVIHISMDAGLLWLETGFLLIGKQTLTVNSKVRNVTALSARKTHL